jgi:hypothetical protein
VAGLPEHLLKRAAEARAKKEGRPVDEVLAEMRAGSEPAEPAPEPVGSPAPPDDSSAPQSEPSPEPQAAAAVSTPAPSKPVIPEAGTRRVLVAPPGDTTPRVEKRPPDKVDVWPHLLVIEFAAMLVVLAFLVIFSTFVDAPLLEFANFNEQPNPSKAPWYFLGLQEMLSYFDPMIAGVLLPGMGLAGIALIPYIDRNPSIKPSDRKLAIMIFTFFLMAAAVLTIFGSFFRGPGFNFTFPWSDGIFFDF